MGYRCHPSWAGESSKEVAWGTGVMPWLQGKGECVQAEPMLNLAAPVCSQRRFSRWLVSPWAVCLLALPGGPPPVVTALSVLP